MKTFRVIWLHLILLQRYIFFFNGIRKIVPNLSTIAMSFAVSNNTNPLVLHMCETSWRGRNVSGRS